jgi:hypothetical protein
LPNVQDLFPGAIILDVWNNAGDRGVH